MSWNDLSLQEKSDFIKLAVKNGVSNMKDIRHIYSSGGKLSLPFKKGVDNLKNPLVTERTLGFNSENILPKQVRD